MASTTQAERIVRIEHPDTGNRFAVSEADYKHKKMAKLNGQTYQEAGYDVVSYEDGTAYEDGAEPSKFAVNRTVRTPEIGVQQPETKEEPANPRRVRQADPAPAPSTTPAPTPADKE